MKKFILLFTVFIPFLTFGQSNPFDKLEYDVVIAYEYQGEGGILIVDCLDRKKEKINRQIELTEKQIGKLELLLTSENSYGNSTMSCFDPHFGIVYYLKNEIVSSVSICLECNYLISSEKIPATELNMINISDDYSYPAKGFSKMTRREIFNYCQEIGFVKYLKPLTSYLDE